MTYQRSKYTHFGVPPLTNCYAKQLWQAIQTGIDSGMQKFVYLDWKQHWRVSDEPPAKGDYWEVNGFNDVWCVSED